VFLIGFVVAGVTAGLQIWKDVAMGDSLTVPHQYTMQTLGGMVTMAVVFRLNQSWNRYWEGVTQLHFMYSKWADSYSQFSGFVSVTVQKTRERPDKESRMKVQLLRDMQQKIENDFLLLSAMACDRICRGDCARMERRHQIGVSWDSRIVNREDLRKGPDLTGCKGMPMFTIAPPLYEDFESVRATQSERELHEQEVDVQGFWTAEYVVNKPPGGMKSKLLERSADRANMVVNWLNHNLAYCASLLDIPPPIQSRMYQEISNGMLGFNNVVKLADIPLSFAHVQIVLILLIVWTCFIPVFVVSFTDSIIAGPILAFLMAALMFALNGVATNLENPFGQSSASICVPEFHSRFVLVVRDATLASRNPPAAPRIRNSMRLTVRSQLDKSEDWDGETHENGSGVPEINGDKLKMYASNKMGSLESLDGGLTYQNGTIKLKDELDDEDDASIPERELNDILHDHDDGGNEELGTLDLHDNDLENDSRDSLQTVHM